MLDTVLAFIAAHYAQTFEVIGIVVTAASAIVKLTPSQKDDAVMAKVVGWLNHLSVFSPKAPK